MLSRLFIRLRGASPWLRIASAVVALILISLAVWLLYLAVYRLFFQGRDAAHDRANTAVATEQQKAEGNIASAAISGLQERNTYHETTVRVVTEGQRNVNQVWHGETVGEDVDRAGADALCRLHHDLCRSSAPEAVQPVCEPVSGRDAPCPAPGELPVQ